MLSSCSKPNDTQISFYYWRTRFKLSSNEKQAISENNTKKLYVRYFDVDLVNGQVVPVAKLSITDTIACEIIPVIFIKNKVMLNDNWDIGKLADQMILLVKQIHQQQTNAELKEIQIDCDWSIRSKIRFMTFMGILKDRWKGILSATIRLHQIKYFVQTGIPPIDYGVLMYYNMGEIDDINQNSIYDKNIASQYTKSVSQYPLPLKIAFPIFSWGIQVRNNKVMGLWSKKRLADLTGNKNLIAISDNKFKVITPFFDQGKYFEKNDIIVYEAISEDQLIEMTNNLRHQNNQFESEVIFYDLDSINILKYDKEAFKKISTEF